MSVIGTVTISLRDNLGKTPPPVVQLAPPVNIVPATAVVSAPPPVVPSVQPIINTGNTVQTVASTTHEAVKGFFERLASQPITAYLGAIFPIAMAVAAFVELVKDFISGIKACFLGLGKDVGEYLQNVIIDFLKLVSALLAPLKFFMDIFDLSSPLALTIGSVVSSVFSLVCYIWQIVRDSIGLNHAGKAIDHIDAAMSRDDISTEEKARLILAYFEEIRCQRVAENQRILENIPEDRREDAVKFLNDQTTVEMETMFGKPAYYRINKGIDCLSRTESQPEEALKAIGAVREIREELVSKSISHWIGIAACICAIASVIFAIACPFVGPAVAVGLAIGLYAMIGLAGVGWTVNGIRAYFSMSKYKTTQTVEQEIELRDARTVNFRGKITGLRMVPSNNPHLAEVEESITRVNKRYFQEDAPEAKRQKIEAILLSTDKFNEYQSYLIKNLEDELCQPMWEALNDIMLTNDLENDVFELEDVFNVDAEQTWEKLSERIKISKNLDTASISLALRREWVETYNQREDCVPFRVYV